MKRIGHFFLYYINRLARVLGTRLYSQKINLEDARFIIFNPRWPDPPRYWYRTMEAALSDAKRLVKKQPKDTFIVMKAIACASIGPGVVVELPGGDTEHEDQIGVPQS